MSSLHSVSTVRAWRDYFSPALVALMLGLLLAALDQALFATAVPTVAGELRGSSLLLWVTAAYVLTGTLSMPVLVRIGSLVGGRLAFTGALLLILGGSVVGGLAQDMPTLVVARAVQGLGGGGLLVLVQAMIAEVVPARQRAQVFTLVGAVFAVAALTGPVLGGWIAQSLGWRWAFWLNLPIGVLALVLAVRYLPPSRAGRVRLGPRDVDLAGLAALTAGLASLTVLVFLGQASSTPSRPVLTALAALAVLFLVAFLRIERSAPYPLLPLSLFTRRNVTVGVVVSFVIAVCVFGLVGYLPAFLQMAAGLSPLRAGLLMLALAAGLGSATVAAAQIVGRTGRYRALPLCACGLVAGGLLLLSRTEVGGNVAVLAAALALIGAGAGCTWEVLVVVIQNAVPSDLTGAATAANGFLRELGVLVGAALVGVLFTSRLKADIDGIPGLSAADAASLTPARLSLLPAQTSSAVAQAYTDAFTPVLAGLVPVALVGVVAALFLHADRLGTRTAVRAGAHG